MSIFEALAETALADRDLLISNNAKGDVFTTPRDVDFIFKTTDDQRADDLCEFINGKSYANAEKRVSESDNTVWVSAVICMPINQNVLNCVSGFMACLARLFQVEYDGWGSVVQPEP